MRSLELTTSVGTSTNPLTNSLTNAHYIDSQSHRRRRKKEEKAKVVAAAWETELIQFPAKLVILFHYDMKKWMNYTYFSNRHIAK